MDTSTKRLEAEKSARRAELIAQTMALPRNAQGDYVATKTCEDCGRTFERTTTPGAAELGIFLEIFLATKDYCSPCVTKMKSDREAAELEERLRQGLDERTNKWAEMCPPIFRENVEERLPAQAKRNLVRVATWKYGSMGLLLAGKTGTGKTRLAYELCRKLHFDDKKKVRIFTPSAFGHQCHRAYSNGGPGPDWADNVIASDVVFLDDFGKLRLTDRIESELFGIIDERMTKGLPMLITTNMTPSALEGAMSDDRGAALVRRISESCETIAFE